ncbi:MAG: hypothetical protein ACOCP8_07050 [archaeon]
MKNFNKFVNENNNSIIYSDKETGELYYISQKGDGTYSLYDLNNN